MAVKRPLVLYSGVPGELEAADTFTGAADCKVGVDAGATPDYLGAAYNDGALRTEDPLTYTDGGDYITLGCNGVLNGWIPANETWVKGTFDHPTYPFKVEGADVSTKYSKGMKVKWQQDCSSKLKVFYKLNETSGTTATDSSGAGNDGTASNADIFSGSVAGKFGYAADLERGSSRYITIKDNSTDANFKANIFTVGAWIKLESNGINQELFTSYTVGAGSKGVIFRITSTNTVDMRIYNTTSTLCPSNTTLSTGTWYFVVGTYNNTTKISKVYINGILENTQYCSAGIGYDTNNYTRIGMNVDTGNYFDGLIDQFFFVNGVELSESVILNIYNNDVNAVNEIYLTDTVFSTTKTNYGIITDVSYSNPDTTIKLYTGNYWMEDTSTYSITNNYYSLVKTPYGFPLSPANWRERNSFAGSLNNKDDPDSTNWWNTSNLLLNIPVGTWNVYYNGCLQSTIASANNIGAKSNLSTTNAGTGGSAYVDDQNWTGATYIGFGASATHGSLTDVYISGIIEVLTSNTIYYLNIKSIFATAAGDYIKFSADHNVKIEATCAYL